MNRLRKAFFVALSATKIGIIIKREKEKRENFEVKDEKRGERGGNNEIMKREEEKREK